jgi:hypothetical protein
MQELAPALANTTTLTSLNVANNSLNLNGGIEALRNAIPDMGSLVSLNLAKNDLGVEGAKHVAEVLPKW